MNPVHPRRDREVVQQALEPEQRNGFHSEQTNEDEKGTGAGLGRHRRVPLVQTRVSIIVPVLNEAAIVAPFLENLRQGAPHAEIIVVDGGSSDGTAELARDFCDHLLVTEKKRSAQMNAGARLASGDVLWFLHADSEVSCECLAEIEAALAESRVAGGYFRIRLPRPEMIYRATDTAAHYLGLLFRVRCGDHAVFCRRSAFDKIGGYPDVPLMEDVEFYRALHRRGKVRVMRTPITTSARRYEQIGPWRLTTAYLLIASLYVAGAPWRLLARLYNAMCVQRQTNEM